MRKGEHLGPNFWESRLSSFFSWVYTQFVAVDANFRLKLKNRRINDPELGSGSFYFVENSGYISHIEKNSKNSPEEEVRYVATNRSLP